MYLKKQQQSKAKTKKKRQRKKDREKKEGVLSRIRTLHHRLHATSLYHYLSTTKDEKEHSFPGILSTECILSTESSKQRLTFSLDKQFFASLSFDLVFMFCPKN